MMFLGDWEYNGRLRLKDYIAYGYVNIVLAE